MQVAASRLAGLALGFAADAVFADPARGHPVAAFGRAAGWLERRLWRNSRGAGATFTAVCAGLPVVVGAAVGRRTRDRPWLATLVMGGATWTALGGTSLIREGRRMSGLLVDDDLPAARTRLSYLCARDSTDLNAGQLARATVESLAENTSDAVVGPLVWGLLAGVPGVLAYRAVNTLDAMVGYHNSRYEHFGWASARLDDLLNLLPARLTALLTAVSARSVGGSAGAAWRIVRRDGRQHPSPNAGLCEAAFAGALGVRLGGVNRYGSQLERRAGLGDGVGPRIADIERAARLSRVVGLAAFAAVSAVGGLTGWRRKRVDG